VSGVSLFSHMSAFRLRCRNENASILAQYAPNAYLVRNYQLEAEAKELQGVIATHKELLIDLNRARRVYQEDKGQHLATLETKWQDLVGSTVQLEMATGAMEGEIRALERREKELLAELQE
jgi:pre-mRNA-splicing factor SPF27